MSEGVFSPSSIIVAANSEDPPHRTATFIPVSLENSFMMGETNSSLRPEYIVRVGVGVAVGKWVGFAPSLEQPANPTINKLKATTINNLVKNMLINLLCTCTYDPSTRVEENAGAAAITRINWYMWFSALFSNCALTGALEAE